MIGDPSRSDIASTINGLDRQTGLTACIEPKQVFSALANQETALAAAMRAAMARKASRL